MAECHAFWWLTDADSISCNASMVNLANIGNCIPVRTY